MSCKVVSLILLAVLSVGHARIFSEPEIIVDAKWTSAINEKLCEEGTHNDDVAAPFYACYNDSVPGASDYKACQMMIYGEPMATKAAIDNVCTSGKFKQYAACLLGRFAIHMVNPMAAVHELAKCQGGVLGVPRPSN